MDPLKKLVAARLKTQVAGPHPDAEVLSAFAENALPANERETVLQHLSTCSDCRDIVFLAVPLAGESQQVVSAPKTRPVFALRWGTLAAGVLIAAVFLVSRHEAPQREQLAKTVPQTTSTAAPPAAAPDTIVAAEKAPSELRELHDKLPAKFGVPAAYNGHAEPKHITAKPEGNMSFADSGEVSVNAPAPENALVESRPVQSLPTVGRNVLDLKQISPGAPQAASAPAAAGTGTGAAAGAVAGLNVGGPIRAKAYSYSGNSADLTAKKDATLHGYVAGTISDASGAVIPNVKVTAIGPLGTKTAMSDQSGKYALDQLAMGNYLLKFDAPGFQEKQLQQVAVLENKPANVSVSLSPGASTETVSVEAAAPAIVSQSGQETALQTVEQKQSANEIQAQQAEVEAAVSKVPKVSKKNKDESRMLSRAAAKTWAVPAWLWSVSAQGVVQRSSDLGKTWLPVIVKESAVFRAISSLGADVWVGGNGGALFHSTDSGLHWTPVVPSAGGEALQSDITQIQFVDSQHLALTTSTSHVWSTGDGGQTWSRK